MILYLTNPESSGEKIFDSLIEKNINILIYQIWIYNFYYFFIFSHRYDHYIISIFYSDTCAKLSFLPFSIAYENAN